ncbi:MAG: IS200/IS605 family accessory protein TnpB-related protein [Candidatus Bathyarchaeia archaeon]
MQFHLQPKSLRFYRDFSMKENMRQRIKNGKRMNRRLHSLPFRRLQFYIEYKAELAGFEVPRP